jgi:hypothetical protein
MFWTGDGLQSNSEVFPFRARPVAAQAPPPRVLAPPPVPKLQAARVIEGFEADCKPPLPAKTHGAGRLVARIALIAAILLCAGAGGYGLAKFWIKMPPPRLEPQPAAPIALRAAWNGSSLDLDWDRKAEQIRHALGAVLWIHDGAKHRRLELGIDDLTQGRIQYWPQSSDVVFHLDVFTPDATASAAVRVLGMPVPIAERPPERPPERPRERVPPRAPERASAAARHRGSASRTAAR